MPGGYVNFNIGVTSYFLDPDGRPGQGLSGTAAPYPISTKFGPAFASDWDIEIPPDTDWDINYFVSNGLVDATDRFPENDVSFTVGDAL